MATRIRLKRMGRKGRPFYRVVVADSRMPRDGRFIDHLGHYDPLPHPAKVVIDEDRALRWLQTGATPTPTVRNLLQKKGILMRWDMERRGLGAPEQKEAMQKFEVMQLERDRRRALKTRKKKPGTAAAAPAGDGAPAQS